MSLYPNNEISEEEIEKNPFCNCNKKNKISMNKLNKGCEGPIH